MSAWKLDKLARRVRWRSKGVHVRAVWHHRRGSATTTASPPQK